MLNDFLVYSLKSAVIFSLLFLPYYLLRTDTFFVRNRIYLLLSLTLAVVLPLISFRIAENENRVSYVLSTISIHRNIGELPAQTEVLPLLLKAALFISFLFVLRFIISIFNILRMIMRNPKERRGRETIVWMQGQADFSFFRFIFLNKNNYHTDIHAHERVHVQRMHSVDIILFELLRCFQWYNPFVWIALSEIKAQHEYEADELTAGSNKNEYQALLLSSVLEGDLVHMTNSFNCLTIKKRFNMMNKKRSPKKAWTKTLLVLPFALLSVGVIAETTVTSVNQEKVVNADEKVVMPEFKGGMQELMKYLASTIKYPEKAVKDKTEGKVFIKFTVDKTGKVKNAAIAKGLSAETDAEALRVIKGMPDWTPGTKNGKKADVEMTLPIAFKLD